MLRKKIIKSGIASGEVTYEFKLKGTTLKELKVYCDYAKIPLKTFQVKEQNKKYYVPGHYFLGLFRYIIPEIKKNDDRLPFGGIESFGISTNATFENRIFLNENLTLKMQHRTKSGERYWMYLEFVRECDDHIVLAGIMDFVPKVF